MIRSCAQVPMPDKLVVEEDSRLLEYLLANLQGWSRRNVKLRLQKGCVCVNGKCTTKHDYGLVAGDKIEISAQPRRVTAPSQLEVLFADRDLIAINKPAGLLSVATAKETEEHAMALLRQQLSRGTKKIALWPVHRIDRDTSGVLLFATSREMREAVMALWDQAEKKYLAVVEGIPLQSRGSIDQPLRMDDVIYKAHVGPHRDAVPALTHYEIIRSVNNRSLLNVRLETGRQHQIRAHLAWLGCPVVGDPRYGTAGGRMGLHALSLRITKPDSGKKLFFETPAPADFMALLKKSANRV